MTLDYIKNPFDHAAKLRLTCVMLFSMAIAGGLLTRAGYLQLFSNPRLESMARKQFQSRALIRPRRGAILDRHGEPLAVNVETNSLAANPGKIRNKRVIARLLAKSTHLPYAKLLHRLGEKKEFVWIKRHLSEAELRGFKKWRVVDSDGDFVDGLWLVKESERVYPHGRLASHILGDVNVDSEGLEGIELYKNDQLRGRVASVTAIKDAYGRPTFIDADAVQNVHDGEPVTLTLDASLQFEVEQELENAIRRTGARAGTVIVMDAARGEILAMANEPSFNPNTKGIDPENRRNRAVTDGYEPGSTLKAVLAAAVLGHGGKLTDQVWGERGSFLVQGHRISEAEAKEKFEWVSLKKMIQVSSNVAAAKFAMRLGSDSYLNVIHSFGFGEKTGVNFPGEIAGKIPPRTEWSPLALANIGFGQGILVTPIQMTRSYAAVLNGGWLVHPTLIKEADPQPHLEKPVRIFSQRVSNGVLEALETVTQEGGTGLKAALPGYRVAGKTGTAQMVDPSTRKYSKDKYVASFIGFPLGVDSKIVIFTSLAEPRGAYYAAETAAPFFKEVLNSVVHRCGLPIRPSPIKILADQVERDRVRLSQASAVMASDVKLKKPEATLGQRQDGWIMPSLKGFAPREVFQILQGYPFQLEMVGSGVVSSQVPEEGKVVAEGSTIKLTLVDP